MKIVLPADATHTLKLIPRFAPYTVLVLSLYNEATKVTTTPANTYYVSNGVLNITFSATVVEDDKYQIKITSGTDVVYRGKMLATAQTIQDFKLTDGLYFYE